MPAVVPIVAGAFSAIGGAVAGFAGTLMGAAGLGAAVSAWATVASVASLAVTLTTKPPQLESQGYDLTTSLAGSASALPIAFGRCAVPQALVYRESGGTNNRDLYLGSILSLGPIAGWEGLYLENRLANWSTSPVRTGSATGASVCTGAAGLAYNSKLYKNQLRGAVTLGQWADTRSFNSLMGGGVVGAHANKPFNGLALIGLKATLDDKGEAFEGEPAGYSVVRGQLLYDPRKDSTLPGGAGSHRLGQPATYEYSNNPIIAALNWALGRRLPNGRLLWGIGAELAELDLPAWLAGANVADANNWTVGGLVTNQDNSFAVLGQLLAAGSATPLARGAQLSLYQNAPKASVLTINQDDVVGSVRVTSSATLRERINRVVPSYRDESQFWQVIDGIAVTAQTYLDEDGGIEKSDDFEIPLSGSRIAATQLAGYHLVNSREMISVDLVGKPRLLNADVGDVVTVNVPEVAVEAMPMLVVGRDWKPGDQTVSLALRSETPAKHAFALGQTSVAPPSPSLSGFDKTNPDAPGLSAWSITGTSITAPNGASTPALVVTGAVDNPLADSVQFHHRKLGSTDWTVAGTGDKYTTRYQITGLQDGQQYEAGVSYTVGAYASPVTAIGSATVGAHIAGGVRDGGINWNGSGPGPIANVPPALDVDPDGNLQPNNIATGVPGQTLEQFTAEQIAFNDQLEADQAAAEQAITDGLAAAEAARAQLQTALEAADQTITTSVDGIRNEVSDARGTSSTLAGRLTTITNELGNKAEATRVSSLEARADAIATAVIADFPEVIAPEFFTTVWAGSPTTVTGLTTAHVVNGAYTPPASAEGRLAFKQTVPWRVGAVYEITADLEGVTTGTTDPAFRMYASALKVDHTDTGTLLGQSTPAPTWRSSPIGTVTSHTWRIAFDVDAPNATRWNKPTDTAHVRFGTVFNRTTGGSATNTGAQTRVGRLIIRDVTAQANVERADIAAVVRGGNQGFEDGLTGWVSLANGTAPATNVVWSASYQGRPNVAVNSPKARANLFTAKRFPINTARKYRMRGSHYVGAGTGVSRTYIGYRAFDGSGALLGSNPLYAVTSAAPAAGSGWHDLQSVVMTGESGTGSSSTGAFPVGTKEIVLQAYLNYDANPDIEAALDGVWLEDITESAAAQTAADAVSARTTTLETATANLQSGKADASRVTDLETTVNAPGSGLTSRLTTVETTTSNLQTNKADASRVSQLEASVTAANPVMPVASPQAAEAYTFSTGAPSSAASLPSANVYPVAGEGQVLLHKGSVFMGPKALIDAKPGSYYKIRFRARRLVDVPVGTNTAYWSLRLFGDGDASLGNYPSQNLGVLNISDGWKNFESAYISGEAIRAAAAGTIRFRPMCRFGSDGSSANQGEVEVSAFFCQEATDASAIDARLTTTESATVELVGRGGGGGNLVGNTSLESTVGWTVFNYFSNQAALGDVGINLPTAGLYNPVGDNCLTTKGLVPTGSYADWRSDEFPLTPGKTFEFGAHAAARRTWTELYLEVRNTAGDQVYLPQATAGGSNRVTETNPGGTDLGTFGQFWAKYTVPAGFTRGRLILRRGPTNNGSTDSWSWFTRPFCREIPASQTQPSPWDYGAQRWLSRARWSVQPAVNGASSFIQAEAVNNDGVATSNVSLGAQSVQIWNPIGAEYKKAMEVSNGRVLVMGDLQAGGKIRLGNGQGWDVALKPVNFQRGDGETILFGTDLGVLPSYEFQRDNLLPLNTGESYDLKLTNLTSTGATVSAKINVPGSPSSQTNSSSTVQSSGPRIQTGVTDASKPVSVTGIYTLSGYVSGTVRVFRQTEEEQWTFTGTVTVWAKKSGVWTQAGTISWSDTNWYSNPSNTNISVPFSAPFSGSPQMGDNVQAIGVSIGDPGGVTSCNPGSLNLAWTSAPAPSGTRSALASGAKTTVKITPQ